MRSLAEIVILLTKHIPFIFFLIFLCFGCVSSKLQRVEPKPANQYAFCNKIEELTISIDPYLESNRNEDTFGVNLISKEIIPIFVVVENNCENTFLIEKKQMSLSCFDSLDHKLYAIDNNAKTEVTKDRVKTLGGIGLAWGAVGTIASGFTVIGVPGILLVPLLSAVNESQNITQHLVNSELPDQTIASNDKSSGFLYFQANDHVNINCSNLTLTMKVINLSNNRDVCFIYYFSAIKGDSR